MNVSNANIAPWRGSNRFLSSAASRRRSMILYSLIAEIPRPLTTPARPYAAPRRAAYDGELESSSKSRSTSCEGGDFRTLTRGDRHSETASWTCSAGVFRAPTRRSTIEGRRASEGSKCLATRPIRMTTASLIWSDSSVAAPVLASSASNIVMSSGNRTDP